MALAEGQLNVKPLITEVIELENYNDIYGDMANSKSIASILKYNGEVNLSGTSVELNKKEFKASKGILGILGAGNFTNATVMPMLKKLNADVKYIASSRGLSGTTTGKKFNVANSTTDYKDILKDTDVDAVIITTQHNAHAKQVIECLEAGKHVFVEKPLALTHEELDKVVDVYNQNNCSISVGF